VGRRFFHFVCVGNMGAKRGIKEAASRNVGNRNDEGPAHKKYYERRGWQVANRAIIHLKGPFPAPGGFIPSLNSITGIPETNLPR
jgi:hypothetical protein